METLLAGRVALVTGASQGIGEAIARALYREGAKVAFLSRDAGKLDTLVAELGGGALAVAGDVTKADSLAAAIGRVESELGPIDIAVNNAGGLRSSTGELFRAFEDVPDEDWQATWELNVMSAVRVARAVLPGMTNRGWGRIINISSESAVQPDPVAVEYGTSKGALNTLTKALAKAYAGRNVLVNVVSPAYVDTPILRELLAQQEGAETLSPDALAAHFLSAFRPNIGLGRPCRPEDVAEAVVFLASERASFITGTNLRVDGGSVTTL
ncbi:SDR family NAD(P)-dependent oxidoreductase [Aureimonas jatrophae]|uniref:NAD(P)-dependent dehydrogenase, short-chain alcohol dehydrogenase family n=1 Tax=Aureimonas jatrophae TaxID=1166073 RepID=A0A1H0DQK1_9HYPH|nr:SDR family oxidoreductase [Aureimonas jatrophae]MBB3952025.1 NAD(P)-dependent dehydrogenase (short-subunit alcohol dehydrogenase family) [Aureimonas jatrophae]SDN72435.1 NAD(P)-dependent dehydrogenase, short-chain alcohol dehydrogenase family [Aureimonas jatrophae]